MGDARPFRPGIVQAVGHLRQSRDEAAAVLLTRLPTMPHHLSLSDAEAWAIVDAVLVDMERNRRGSPDIPPADADVLSITVASTMLAVSHVLPEGIRNAVCSVAEYSAATALRRAFHFGAGGHSSKGASAQPQAPVEATRRSQTPDSSGSAPHTHQFHTDWLRGIEACAQLAMQRKYHGFESDGCRALYTRPPVIYVCSEPTKREVERWEDVRLALALPAGSLRFVPPRRNQSLDLAGLEATVLEDGANGCTPLFVALSLDHCAPADVATATRLKTLCDRHGMWLHALGNALAAFAVGQTTPVLEAVAASADAIALDPAAWVSLPGTPYVTLLREPAPPSVRRLLRLSARVDPAGHFGAVVALAECLRRLGRDGVCDRVRSSLSLSRKFADRLSTMSSLRRIDAPNAPHMVLFGYSGPDGLGQDEGVSLSTDGPSPGEVFAASANASVVAALSGASHVVGIEPFGADGKPCLKFDPFVRGSALGTSPEAWLNLEKCLDAADERAGAIAAAIRCRPSFADAVVASDSLHLAAINPLHGLAGRERASSVGEDEHVRPFPFDSDGPTIAPALMHPASTLSSPSMSAAALVAAQSVTRPSWLAHTVCTSASPSSLAARVGLGAVRYVPPFLSEAMMTGDVLVSLEQMNAALADRLAELSPVYSRGKDADGHVCVVVGVVDSSLREEHAGELVALVAETATALERSTHFIDDVSVIIQQVIQKAEDDIRRETEHKLQEEGFIRQLPVVGSVLSWWSPPPKTTELSGRSFSLTSGVLESTEAVIKRQGKRAANGASATEPIQE